MKQKARKMVKTTRMKKERKKKRRERKSKLINCQIQSKKLRK